MLPRPATDTGCAHLVTAAACCLHKLGDVPRQVRGKRLQWIATNACCQSQIDAIHDKSSEAGANTHPSSAAKAGKIGQPLVVQHGGVSYRAIVF
jgi:hypothetical protein